MSLAMSLAFGAAQQQQDAEPGTIPQEEPGPSESWYGLFGLLGLLGLAGLGGRRRGDSARTDAPGPRR